MTVFCLTAGTDLAGIIWAAHVLPDLRRARPDARLIWEAPTPDLRRWTGLYPELDEVVADAEELPAPPDAYLILHPAWLPGAQPIPALFALAGFEPPAALPASPRLPPGLPEIRPALQLPPAYVCFDPFDSVNPAPERAQDSVNFWASVAGRLPLPTVQVGDAGNRLAPAAIDARGRETIETARIIERAALFIGADSDSSCLALALAVPQIWIAPKRSPWPWPRGGGARCRLHEVDGTAEASALAGMAAEILAAQGERR